MTSIYFNSEIVGAVPYAERFRSFCCRPLHYFCDGKIREFSYGRLRSRTEESYTTDQKNCLKTLKMAVLIIPGLIVGTIAAVVAAVAWRFNSQLSQLRYGLNVIWLEKYEKPIYMKRDLESSFKAPTYELTADFSLNRSHEQLKQKWIAFLSKITSKDSWKTPSIRKEFDEIISEAHKEMHLLFQHAAKASGNDPTRMAQLMAEQHVYSDRNGENYCRAFFFNSIGYMYNAARHRTHFATTAEGLDEVRDNNSYQNAMRSENTTPFFTPGTDEQRWRLLYNDACGLIDQYPGLRAPLYQEDSRFSKCATPHASPSLGFASWNDTPTM
ncbi:MAG: hypothetical protein H0X51_04085 [Parachlamydiaceae bacterium]|nr:hypothetical protein [Parachlamydiaceae bacterium]